MKKLLITLFASFILLFSSCNACNQSSFKKSVKSISKDLLNVTYVSQSITMKDKDVLVFDFEQTTSFKEGNLAEITTITKTLSNKTFELETEKRTDTQNVDRNKLVSLDLNFIVKDLKDFNITKDQITFTASKNQAMKILGLTNTEFIDGAYFEFNFTNKRISSINVSYKTNTNKDVLINTIYNY